MNITEFREYLTVITLEIDRIYSNYTALQKIYFCCCQVSNYEISHESSECALGLMTIASQIFGPFIDFLVKKKLFSPPLLESCTRFSYMQASCSPLSAYLPEICEK